MWTGGAGITHPGLSTSPGVQVQVMQVLVVAHWVHKDLDGLAVQE